MVDRRFANQVGVALISALVIVVIVTAAAVSLAKQQRLEIRRTDNLFVRDSSQLVLATLEGTAAALLVADSANSRHDDLDEAWANAIWTEKLNGIDGVAHLEDLNARFNMNNLAPSASSAAQQTQQTDAMVPGNGLTSDTSQPAADGANDAQGPKSPAPRATGADARSSTANLSQIAAALSETFSYECEFVGHSERTKCEKVRGKRVRDISSAQVNRFAAERNAGTAEADDGKFQTASGRPTAPSGSESGPGPGPRPQPHATAANTPGSATPRATSGQPAVAIAEQRLRALFAALNLDSAPVQAILDWLDADSDTRFPNGAEDDYYLELDPPYRAANRHFSDVRELTLVRGISPEMLAKLEPFVDVFSEDTAINVNTAGAEIIMSLSPYLDRARADSIIRSRQAQPFVSLKQFAAIAATSGQPIALSGLSVSSNRFQLVTSLHGERLAQRALSTLMRESGAVQLVARRSGLGP